MASNKARLGARENVVVATSKVGPNAPFEPGLSTSMVTT